MTLEICICTNVHRFTEMTYINMGLHIKIGLFTFLLARTKMAKSACFWLFVNEITMLAVWNHLVRAPRGLFASNPTWHPSEVRILLWLRCLQEVLRATKNLAKIIHESIMNAKALPAIERLPDKPGTFLWEPGYTWRNHPEAKAERERESLLSFSWHGLLHVSKTAVCHVWVLPCCSPFPPLQRMA